MIEKTPLPHMQYQKKITPYLDGSMSAEERSEFEAFVLTHPEFETYIRIKEDEINLLKSLIPTVSLSPSALSALETEMKSSVFNLLKEEPKTIFERVKLKWEDWVNR